MTPLSTIIAKLREVEAKATKGPWRYEQVRGLDATSKDKAWMHYGNELLFSPVPYGDPKYEFIAHARNTYPALLDALEIAIGALRNVGLDECTTHAQKREWAKEALASIQKLLEEK